MYINTYVPCMIMCIAFNAILSCSSIAGCVALDENGDKPTQPAIIAFRCRHQMVFNSYPFFSFLFVDSEWSVCWINVWMVKMVVVVDVDVDVDWRCGMESLALVETIVQV